MTKALEQASSNRGNVRALALLAVVALLVAGIGSYGGYRIWRHFHVPQTTIADAVQIDSSLNGQKITVLTPEASGTERPLALVTHGYDSDQRILRTPYMAAMTQGLIDAGWVVASSEADGNAWGGGSSQDDYVALHEYVTDNYDISRTVMVSVSMGAIPGLNIVADQRIPDLSGWVGISPVTDLTAMSESDDWSAIISSQLTAAEAKALDPAGRDYPQTLPMAIMAAPDDEATPMDEQVIPFSERTGARVTECSGRHVSPDCFRAESVTRLN